MTCTAYNFNLNDPILDLWVKNDNLIRPTYSMFDDPSAIQFKEVSYVTSDLIPVVEYKLIVNKECLHRHRFEWKPFFELYVKVHGYNLDPNELMSERIVNNMSELMREHIS